MSMKLYNTNNKNYSTILLFAIFIAIMPYSSDAMIIMNDSDVSDYTSLANDSKYSSIGWLGGLDPDNNNNLIAVCTGILVSQNQVLTAAHCLDENVDGVFDYTLEQIQFGLESVLPSVFVNNVYKAVVNPLWDGLTTYDMAIITLTENIVSIPATIWGGDIALHSSAITSGYGIQGDGLGNSINWGSTTPQNRLAARNNIDVFGIDYIAIDFDNQNGTTSTFGNTIAIHAEGSPCYGDSGGGLFLEGGYVVGVLHGATNNFGSTCEYGTIPTWSPTGNPANINFLRSQGVAVAISEPPDLFIFFIGLLALNIVGLTRDATTRRLRFFIDLGDFLRKHFPQHTN